MRMLSVLVIALALVVSFRIPFAAPVTTATTEFLQTAINMKTKGDLNCETKESIQ